jgi:hypothetical protein
MKIKNNVIESKEMRYTIYLLALSFVLTVSFVPESIASVLTTEKSVEIMDGFGNNFVKRAWFWFSLGGVMLSTLGGVLKNDIKVFGKGVGVTVLGTVITAAMQA